MHISTCYSTGMHRYGDEHGVPITLWGVYRFSEGTELVSWKLQSINYTDNLQFSPCHPCRSLSGRVKQYTVSGLPCQSPHTHTHTRVASTAFLHPAVSVSLPTAYSAVDHIPFAVHLILFLPFSLFIPTMRLPNAATNTRTERHVVKRLYNNFSMSDH